MTSSITDLTAGTIAGREHVLVINDGTHAAADFIAMPQARNLTFNKKRDATVVELHGSEGNDHSVGNMTKDGAFEYVKRRGADDIYDKINDAIEDSTIEEIGILDGPANSSNSVGIAYPMKLTEMNMVANGNSETVYSVSFVKVKAYDASDDLVDEFAITGTDPA